MTWINVSFRSKMLNMPVEAEVLAPQRKGGNFKVLLLLHGANNDRTEWLLKSQIFDMVKTLPVLVFMPSAKNSFYVNTANGYRYMDYVTKEIPEFIRSHFRVSEDCGDWLIAGESMGGYGALVCGLNCPQRFGNIAAFSGALDIMSEKTNQPGIDKKLLFGNDMQQVMESNYNLYTYCHKVPENMRPRIFQCCGQQDGFLEMNRDFYDEIKNEYEVCYLEEAGEHNFTYWNRMLPKMLQWFLSGKEEVTV